MVQFSDLVPLRSGKFQTTAEGRLVEEWQSVELFTGRPIPITSNSAYNLRLLRGFYPHTLLLQSKDWLSSLLTTTTQPVSTCYNFALKSPSEAMKALFRRIPRKGDTRLLPEPTHIVIDDLHLCPLPTVNALTDLAEYHTASIQVDSNIETYRIPRYCKFTLASKTAPLVQKCLAVRMPEGALGTIFNDYVHAYCEGSLKLDRSSFSLLNLSNSINRLFKGHPRYYWFSNPLLHLQQRPLESLSQLTQTYLECLADMLPWEKTRIMEQGGIEDEEQLAVVAHKPEEVINTNKKYQRFVEEN